MAGNKAGWIKRRVSLFDYIISKIHPDENGCWNWGNTREGKYGFFQYEYNTRAAHIAVYEYCFGKVPKGLVVRHKCDNTRCVRPSHLETGTKKDNRRDFMERNPKANALIASLIKNGSRGVKRFWDNMTPEQRKDFSTRRAAIQAQKRAA